MFAAGRTPSLASAAAACALVLSCASAFRPAVPHRPPTSHVRACADRTPWRRPDPRRRTRLRAGDDEEEEDRSSSASGSEGGSLPAALFSEDSVPSNFGDGDPPETIGSIRLEDEISASFLTYALSTITGRALPDARDGLKPVHRRILYTMHSLNLRARSPHRKCARVVGEALGKYHPHGDSSVYDALVRMAQPFAAGTPLVDGHGNFGSVDGDPAAAMRYTECRLSGAAEDALLGDLGDVDRGGSVVPYVPNFDGSESEPAVLPARLPVLLLNGCAGIAVGMATNVPPHNLQEVSDACIALLDARDRGAALSDARLYELVPGPDFPTGASIVGRAASRTMHSTGRGSVTMRAITNIETVAAGRTTRNAIVVTELPYAVNKATLVENIAQAVNDRKIEGIADLRDESDRDGVRIVIELKRDANVQVVKNNLLKKTSLQTNFAGNFLALFPGTDGDGGAVADGGGSYLPRRFTLRQALDTFLDFRFQTVRKRSQLRLDKAARRAHIVDGLVLALEKVDEVVEAARNSDSAEAARLALATTIGLSPEQADAVLKLQLGQLTRMSAGRLTDERAELAGKIGTLEDLMTQDTAVRDLIRQELAGLRDAHGVPRRTLILPEEDGSVREEDLIRNTRSVIVVTRGGYIKRMPLANFEQQGRGTRGKRGTNSAASAATSSAAAAGGADDVHPSDIAHCFTCNDHDTLLVVAGRGVAFGIRAHRIPAGSRTARGVPIPSVLPTRPDDDVAAILPVTDFAAQGKCIVLATEQGWIKRTPLDAFERTSSRGLNIANVGEDDTLRWCCLADEGDDVLLGTAGGLATRFRMADLRPTGRTSRGVRSMKLKDGDRIADVSVIPPQADGEGRFLLTLTAGGYGKRVRTDEFSPRGRGGAGIISIKFKDKSGGDRTRCLRAVDADDEVLLVTEQGIIVRQKAGDIPVQGRSATGVLVQKVDGGDSISRVSIVPKRLNGSEDLVQAGEGAADGRTAVAAAAAAAPKRRKK